MVLFAGKDRVHSLRITTLDGKEFVLDVKEKSDSEMEGAAEKTAVARPTESDSNNSILSSPEKSNTKKQERDELPDDRELLMAVEARGKNAEALTAYQKKVKALEALQRKLGRQREALAAAKETDSHANAEALARNDKTEERIVPKGTRRKEDSGLRPRQSAVATGAGALAIMIIGWRNQSRIRLISLPNDRFGSE